MPGPTLESASAHVLARIAEAEAYLGRLDSAAGDGDHGRTLVRGLKAAVAAIPSEGDLGTRIMAVGAAFAEDSGGASGALYGALLRTVGRGLRDGSPVDVAVRAGLDRLKQLGGAEPGDKTMVDALEPFCAALSERLAALVPLAEAWRLAADEARRAADATATLVGRKGRSAALGERSLGHPDPGAVSMAIILAAIGESLVRT